MNIFKLCTAAFACIAASPSRATIFLDFASFDAATSGNSFVIAEFSNPTLVDQVFLAQSTVRYKITGLGGAINANGVVRGPGWTGFAPGVTPLISNVVTGVAGEALRFEIPAARGAMGFDVLYNDLGPLNVTFFLDDGTQQLVSVPADQDGTNNYGFIGLTSHIPIKAFEFVSTSGEIVDAGFDNVRIVPLASEVPEPATWGMMILGFGFVGASLRGHRRKAAMIAQTA
ncbi:MAG: PEPxxWA-CTERM sorting domain-containing protein [Sphingobium sp.]